MKELKKYLMNKKIIFALVGVIVLLIGTGVAIAYKVIADKNNDATYEAAPETTEIERRDLSNTIRVSGTIISSNSRTVSTQLADKKVEKVSVSVGDYVKEGDVIAVLESTAIEKTLEVAEAKLKAAKVKEETDVAAAQRNYDYTVTGSGIKNERNKTAVNNAENTYNNAKSSLDTTSAQYQESEKERISKENAASGAQSDASGAKNKLEEKEKYLSDCQRTKDNAETQMNQAKSAYDNVLKENGQAEEKKVAYETSQSAYETAKGTYEAAKGAYEAAKQEYEKALEAAQGESTEDGASQDAGIEQKKQAMDAALADAEQKKQSMDAAEGTFKQASSEYENALNTQNQKSNDLKKAYDDAVNLFNQAFGSLEAAQADYDSFKSEYEKKTEAASNAKESVATAKEKESTLKGEKQQAESTLTTSKETLNKAKESMDDGIRSSDKDIADQKGSLTNAKISGSDSYSSLEEEVEKYRLQLDSCTITAPCDGIVTTISLKEGEVCKGGDLAVIQDDKNFKVSALVDQYDISDISKGMKVKIRLGATADGEEMGGTVSFISPTPQVPTDSKTKTSSNSEYAVEAQIDKPSERLRIGMMAKTSIIIDEKKNVLAVPDSCVQTDEQGKFYIEVLEGDNTIKKYPVTYGIKTDYYSEINGDKIKEGMKVIVPAAEEAL